MLHKARSERDVRRKVSPPGPTYMTDTQMSEYLANLRNNRPARPAGSRPLPGKSSTSSVVQKPSCAEDVIQTPAPADEFVTALPQVKDDTDQHAPSSFHRRGHSDMRFSSIGSRKSVGRPLVQDPSQATYSIRGRNISPTAVIQPATVGSGTEYRESGTRWMERQEAVSLKHALEIMDLKGDEERLHDAAKNEAAELVWEHQNPKSAEAEKTAAYENPDIEKYRFKQHLQKGAHARSQSQSYGELAKRMSRSTSDRSISNSSTSSNEARPSTDLTSTHSRTTSSSGRDDMESQFGDPGAVPEIGSVKASSMKHTSGARRNISSGSAKGLFRNPEDEIYEDNKEAPAQSNSPHVRFDMPAPLQVKQRNSLPRGSRPLPDTSNRPYKRFNPFEIHRNAPSQSRNAGYLQNDVSKPPTVQVEEEPKTKDGLEIRSDDIRAATSMRRRDRSPNLPTPTAVSDRPGRPIVSFDPTWQPSRTPAKDSPPSSRGSSVVSKAKSVPALMVSDTPVPTINLPEDEPAVNVPTIVLPGEDNSTSEEIPPVPSINLPSTEERSSTIPVMMISPADAAPPIPAKSSARPLPNPATMPKSGKRGRLPWIDRGVPPVSRAGVPTASCDNCSLPIEGRVVTATGSYSHPTQKARFHPECFTCFHCSTSLEAADFYPEPDNKRAERLEREGLTEGDEGTALRFYCHLDFHEFFSPRCKNCKTPIVGEVIVAAGAEWHVGHFFCAECGDPFDASTPFVEKDGYAWCVSCHTRRTSSRCRGCKKPVLDEVTITALGGQWHSECFVCLECGGDFGDEGRFFVREIEIPLTEKEKRRGLKPRMEERAVCRGCEERRLKA